MHIVHVQKCVLCTRYSLWPNFLRSSERQTKLLNERIHFSFQMVSCFICVYICAMLGKRSKVGQATASTHVLVTFLPFYLVVVSNTIFQHPEITKSSSEVESHFIILFGFMLSGVSCKILAALKHE